MTIQAFKLGALGQDSLTGTKCIAAWATAANRYMTFEYPVGTDYQVPVGKTLYITKINLGKAAAGSNNNVIIGYGDNGVADGVTAPTNYLEVTAPYGLETGDRATDFDVLIVIPAQKYPCIKCLAGASPVSAYGIEV